MPLLALTTLNGEILFIISSTSVKGIDMIYIAILEIHFFATISADASVEIVNSTPINALTRTIEAGIDW
ncbi:MAG: hypothetical protein QOC96_497 [Acidobacteriota bacterium]|nr:hypothetical protein [Acidobacteriota bacterium]